MSWCVVIAPIVTVLPSDVMPDSPSPDRSTTAVGRFSRCFSTGMNVCPPASGLLSTSSTSICNASGSDEGFVYVKSYMASLLPLPSAAY